MMDHEGMMKHGTSTLLLHEDSVWDPLGHLRKAKQFTPSVSRTLPKSGPLVYWPLSYRDEEQGHNVSVRRRLHDPRYREKLTDWGWD
jgi:hypothetical protein